MLTETQKTFLASFGKESEIEINNLSSIVKEIKDTENIYFLVGGTPDKRNNDNDIKRKNYFVIDLDIRKYFTDIEKTEISDEDIKEIGNFLGNYLITNGKYGLNQWRWIAFSGNGIHVYYVGNYLEVGKDITPKEYQSGVIAIYEAWETVVDGAYMKPDYACRNIARIMRLPGTINQKTGKRCEILAEQNIVSQLVAKLPEYGRRRIKQEEELQELRAKKYILEQRALLMEGKDNEIMKRILDYPVEVLLMESGKINIKGFVKGKNFIDPRDNSYYAFYKANDGNYIVVGGSSTLGIYADGKKGLDPFGLVKGLYGYTDSQVYSFFKNKLG